MVDEDIIAANPLAIEGLKMLHASGVIGEQIDRIIESYLTGDTDEPIEDVTRKVMDSRRRISNLRSLDELGAQYSKGDE